MKKIKLINEYDGNVFVILSPQHINLKEIEVEHSESDKVSLSNKNAVEFKGIELSNEKSVSYETSVSHRERKVYEWSDFLKEGEIELLKGHETLYTLDSNKYWLTIRIDNRLTLVNRPCSVEDGSIVINKNGTAFLNETKEIKFNTNIYLKHLKSGKFIQNPVRSKSWPCGNIGLSKGFHHIISVDLKSDILTSDNKIKIVCNNDTSAGDDCKGYNRLYSSTIGWIYYDENSDNKKQHWVIEKIDSPQNSSGTKIRNNDIVRFRNCEYTQAYLCIDKTENWLSCENMKSDQFQIILG